jgi:D-methionine transport system ATP-binding protein
MDLSYIITLKDIEHPYSSKNNENSSLKRINLDVERGEIIGIIGRSGSGKSTLLKCINMLEHPATGMVCIDKKNFTIMVNKDLRKARQEIGMISQQTSLLATKNVFSNIALPLELKGVSRQVVVAAVNRIADFVGLNDKLSLYPNQLSNALKQKVALARALVINPKILLCDEITTGLDNKTTQSILHLLKEINKEFRTTIVIITHDTEVIKTLCNRICIMHQGEIIEQTSVLELFVKPRTEIAKDFIRASTRLEMPWSYRRNLRIHPFEDSHPIIRMVFTGCVPSEIFITHAIETFQIKTIIIQAHQEVIQNNVVNILLMETTGEPEQIESAVKYFRENNLYIEIIGYVNDYY